MINNDTVVTSTIFGIGAGLMTEQWITIAVGAIAVGVIQPFFRILWTNLLISKNKQQQLEEVIKWLTLRKEKLRRKKKTIKRKEEKEGSYEK